MYFLVLRLGRVLDQTNVDDVENSAGFANSFQVVPVTRILHLTCQSVPDSDLNTVTISSTNYIPHTSRGLAAMTAMLASVASEDGTLKSAIAPVGDPSCQHR